MRFDFRGNLGGGSNAPIDLENLTIPPNAGAWLKLAAAGVLVLFLLIAVSVGRGIYIDWQWFRSVDLSSVYVTVITTRLWLFFAGAVVYALIATPSVVLAFRFSQGELHPSLPPAVAQWMRKSLIWVAVFAVLILSAIFGAVISGQWETFLRFFNSQSFGVTDPLFNRDIGFYVFTLPMVTTIQGWLLGALVITLLGTGGLYFLLFSLRGLSFPMTFPVKAHLSTIAAVLFVVIAWSYWVDLFELLYSPGGAAFGAGYTDVHARVPALRVLMAVTAAGAVLLVGNIFISGFRLALAAVALWIGAVILVGTIYPAAIQRFQVEPNELTLERQYIERNIEATRHAFGLTDIQVQPFPATEEITAETIDNHPGIINNIRVWGTGPLRSLYNQRQFIRPYYDFLDVDVDRYEVDGEYRQVLLGARELSPDKLPDEAQGWVNQRLQWTHGYGAAMSPVNEFTPEGLPNYFLQDVPPQGSFELARPEIYYGEQSRNFVVVNSKEEEVDFPTDEGPVYTQYQGQGGVPIDSFIDRLAFAWHFRDLNLLISSQVTNESRIQFRREIQERILTLAPFLSLDRDPYLVIADSQLFWIQDAYTTSDQYPYSQPFEGGDFNYIRNSVKVVVSAYDGTVDFYVVDQFDPVVATYQSIFPELFAPLGEMPASLQEHVRYPLDLFTIQSQTYLTFHMTDSGVFYNREDQWSIPQEVVEGSRQPVEPYYVISQLLESEIDEFLLIQPFTPVNRPNMVAWLAARNDVPNYGELILYNFPRERQIDGPAQVEARIDNDAAISEQFTLWGQVGSTVIRGNLLVIPIEESILYIEPIYLQAENLAFPELRRIIVADATRVTMQPTLEEALRDLFGGVAPPPVDTPDGGEPLGIPTELSEELQRLADSVAGMRGTLSDIEEALARLQQLAQETAP